MRGLALEGGGAKGAYHIGVVKALIENGYEFDGFVGTSIGSVNAAALAQNNFAGAYELWMNISLEQIFDDEEIRVLNHIDSNGLKLSPETTAELKSMIRKIRHGGFGTERMREFLEANIDETKVRTSNKDYGLVTLSIKGRKPYELMLDDIPHGQLINYIIASSSFPGLRPQAIGEDKFIDGAFYDNCPYRLLLNLGYDEIIAVRTNAFGIFRKTKDHEKVKIIAPQKNLGGFMAFSPEKSAVNIELGYNDGLEFIRNHHT
ncbi:MAG: patatin-like phospholipase family protein [Lachnospiraceae bacterium]|nr:patatin-like phospholipase family protein [Lachnospiraceae bacterium]